MKKFAALLLAGVTLSGCGYVARDGEAIGQVKKVTMVTPLICPGYYAVDVSLGVMRNGVGSMSTQDMWLTVRNTQDLKMLQDRATTAGLVKFRYDTRRLAICTEDQIMTSAEPTQ